MLKRSIIIAVAVLMSVLSVDSYAQTKIGVYDNGAILQNLPDLKKQITNLNAEFESSKKKINELQNKLKTLKEDIEKNESVLSASEISAKQLEFQSTRRELQLLAEDTERAYKVRQNEIVRKIQLKIEAEVVKLAEDQSFDLILRSGVLYADPKLDITQEVLKRLSSK